MVFSKLIYTFLVSMIPAVEVKGAIPFGMALQLAPWQAYLMALSGSFFCRMFSGIFYTLVLCGMQKAWISETIYRLDR